VKEERSFMTDRFPEAFRRFEEDVDVSEFESLKQLESAFAYWSGPTKWIPTFKQRYALEREARRIGLPREGFRKTRSYYFPSLPRTSWKYEKVKVKGKIQHRYRDTKTGRFVKKP
jgi:hypothetical protein